MSFYTLLTRQKNEEAIWKPCAIYQAGGQQEAAQLAKTLRRGGSIGFVNSPAEFQIRRSTRSELHLLAAFFSSFSHLPLEGNSTQEQGGFLARRQKLMLSFFVGIYHDLENMKKHYLSGQPVVIKKITTGTGGQDTEIQDNIGNTQPQTVQDSQNDILSSILADAETQISGSDRDDTIELDIF